MVVVNFLNKRNQADQRVYELLNEKLAIFKGVFDASDNMLGAIESGVDFEKSIAEIYRTCRKEDEINEAFNQLQSRYEKEIEKAFIDTHRKVLDNFDEEVQEKLRLNDEKSDEYVNRVTRNLGSVTRQVLQGRATFTHDEMNFTLTANPFHPSPISKGCYSLLKNGEGCHYYRMGHPLAQRVLKEAAGKVLPPACIDFNLKDYHSRVRALQPLQGKEGWLILRRLTISSLEDQEILCFTGIATDRTRLTTDQCHRLFNLGGEVRDAPFTADAETGLEALWQEDRRTILESIAEDNDRYFAEEIEKLNSWEKDKSKSQKYKLEAVEGEIKALEKASRQCAGTAEMMKLRAKIGPLRNKSKEESKKYAEAISKIIREKDDRIKAISTLLEQKEVVEELFTIHWRVL